MCYKVYPILEMLQLHWEGLLEADQYVPVHHALAASLENMQKWYQKMDDTSIHFISHSMFPLFNNWD